MRWRKLGLVYKPDARRWWSRTHAQVPTPIMLRPDRIRIYISCCDARNVSRVGYVEVAADDPTQVLHASEAPVLDDPVPGTFDENGVVATSVIQVPDGRLFMYYTGFELGHQIRYRLLTGLAVSADGGESFRRLRRTPVLDRSDAELYFRCAPFVTLQDDHFRMWYVAGSRWTTVAGKEVPVYEIRVIESADGARWPDAGRPCIQISGEDEHGFGRPYVLRCSNGYRMFYSVRRVSHQAYRMGMAESMDAITWTRRDAQLGLDVSEHGWDSQSVCYGAAFAAEGRLYLFYNGNGFGETGFGVASLENEG